MSETQQPALRPYMPNRSEKAGVEGPLMEKPAPCVMLMVLPMPCTTFACWEAPAPPEL